LEFRRFLQVRAERVRKSIKDQHFEATKVKYSSSFEVSATVGTPPPGSLKLRTTNWGDFADTAPEPERMAEWEIDAELATYEEAPSALALLNDCQLSYLLTPNRLRGDARHSLRSASHLCSHPSCNSCVVVVAEANCQIRRFRFRRQSLSLL
jgi:hypothetical protein